MNDWLFCAYVMVALDLREGRIARVAIMSDDHPTLVGDGLVWARITWAGGTTFEEAATKALSASQSMAPLLANFLEPADVVKARRDGLLDSA